MGEAEMFLNFIVGAVIPLLVGVVTKAKASSAVKGIANTILSVIAATIVVAIKQELKFDASLGIAAAYAFVGSTVAYTTLWKPTGIAAAIANATADVGIGKEVAVSPPVPPTPPPKSV